MALWPGGFRCVAVLLCRWLFGWLAGWQAGWAGEWVCVCVCVLPLGVKKHCAQKHHAQPCATLKIYLDSPRLYINVSRASLARSCVAGYYAFKIFEYLTRRAAGSCCLLSPTAIRPNFEQRLFMALKKVMNGPVVRTNSHN